jgi:hypothetical protein
MATVHHRERTPLPGSSAGIIYFAQKMEANGEPGGKTCSINIQAGTTNMADTDCKNDVVSYYRLDNAVSASLISFDSERGCTTTSQRGDWRFTLRTFGTASTGWKKIEDLKNLPKEYLVDDWVWLEEGIYNGGNIEGKLSCVQIRR